MSTEEEYEELYKQGFNGEIEDSEEIEEEDLEQPTEEEEVQPTEEDDDSTEEATEADDEDSNESEEEDTETSDEEPYMVIERFGEKIPLSKEEAVKMSQLGWDYTSKTQDLSQHRKRLEIIDGLPEEVLQALKDVSAGKKEALASIAEKFDIDPYELDGVGEYKPEIIEKNYELEDVIESIKSDVEGSSVIDTWINELPSSVNNLFASNPRVLKGLHIDLQNGVAKKVMPEVIKTMKLNPMADFVRTYQEIGSKMVSTKTEEKPTVSREQKKKAVPSKVKPSRHLKDHKSVWEDNDLFNQMRKKAGLIN